VNFSLPFYTGFASILNLLNDPISGFYEGRSCWITFKMLTVAGAPTADNPLQPTTAQQLTVD